jgi:hypothetical protein
MSSSFLNPCRAPVALGAIALALAISPTHASAAATGKPAVTPGSFAAGFQLQGSRGYNLSVIAFGHRLVSLTASKGGASATYTTRGRASRKGIEADFGSLGEIAVRFDGSPAPRRGPRGSGLSCKGRKAIRMRGAFHGTIRFSGENGFTGVDAHRAQGRFSRSFRQVCRGTMEKKSGVRPPRQPKSGRPRFQSDTLTVESGPDGSQAGLLISATEFHFGPGKDGAVVLALIVAESSERVGAMTISRSVFTVDEGASLRVTKPGVDPTVATVKLPKPFAGTATYRQDAGLPPTWTGPLGVRLPGAGTVALTGAGFEPSLCRASTEKALDACMSQLRTSTIETSA